MKRLKPLWYTFHFKKYRKGHERMWAETSLGTERNLKWRMQLVGDMNCEWNNTLLEAFLYLVTAWLMRSLTSISPLPQGTTTLTGPKHTVTFIVVVGIVGWDQGLESSWWFLFFFFFFFCWWIESVRASLSVSTDWQFPRRNCKTRSNTEDTHTTSPCRGASTTESTEWTNNTRYRFKLRRRRPEST